MRCRGLALSATLIVVYLVLLAATHTHAKENEVSLKSQTLGKCAATATTPGRWGHLFVSGSQEYIEFFTSEFSALFPCEATEFAFAEPELACSPLIGDYTGKTVLVKRGECSFQQKAEAAAQAGASVMIVENSQEDGLFAMPEGLPQSAAPLESDGTDPSAPKQQAIGDHNTKFRTISSVLVRPRAAALLRHHFKYNPTDKILLESQYTLHPETEKFVSCGECRDGAKNLDQEQTALRKRYIDVTRSGHVTLFNHENPAEEQKLYAFDFFGSFTGVSLPAQEQGLPMEVPEEGNEMACGPIMKPDVVPDSVFLIARGGCPFVEKFNHAIAAGAAAVIIINNNAEMSLPGVTDEQLNPFRISYQPGSVLGAAITFEKAGQHAMKIVRQSASQVIGRFTFTPSKDLISLKSFDQAEETETTLDNLQFSKEHPDSLSHLLQQMNLDDDSIARTIFAHAFPESQVEEQLAEA